MENKLVVSESKPIPNSFFSNMDYEPIMLENPKIYHNKEANRYTMFTFILLDDKKPAPQDIKDIKGSQREQINKAIAFKDFANKKSKGKLDLVVAFYYSKESENAQDVILFQEDQLVASTLADLSTKVLTANNKASNEPTAPVKLTAQAISQARQGDSPQDLFKAIIVERADNALDIQKVLHIKSIGQAILFNFIPTEDNGKELKSVKEYVDSQQDKYSALSQFSEAIKSTLFLTQENMPEGKGLFARVDSAAKLEKVYSRELQPKLSKPKPEVAGKEKDNKNKKQKGKEKQVNPNTQMTFKF